MQCDFHSTTRSSDGCVGAWVCACHQSGREPVVLGFPVADETVEILLRVLGELQSVAKLGRFVLKIECEKSTGSYRSKIRENTSFARSVTLMNGIVEFSTLYRYPSYEVLGWWSSTARSSNFGFC